MKLGELKWEELNTLSFAKKYEIVHSGFESDDSPSDVILLLGGPLEAWDDRIAAAFNLWKKNGAKKVIVSGSFYRDTEDQGRVIEAQGMANRLVKMGMPREIIIEEGLARTTQENMIYGALEIYRNLSFEEDKVKSITIVTSFSHMRRSLQLAKSFLPYFVDIKGYPGQEVHERMPVCETIPFYNFRVHEELRLIHILIKTGQMEDIEI